MTYVCFHSEFPSVSKVRVKIEMIPARYFIVLLPNNLSRHGQRVEQPKPNCPSRSPSQYMYMLPTFLPVTSFYRWYYQFTTGMVKPQNSQA